MSERHEISIQKNLSREDWTLKTVRTICSCGFVGDWRNPGVYSAPGEHGHDRPHPASVQDELAP